MICEIKGCGRSGSSRRKCDHVAAAGTNRIGEIPAQPTTPHWIGHKLILKNPQPGMSVFEVEEFPNHGIDESSNVSGPNSITISVDSNKTSPGTIRELFEDRRSESRVHHRVGATSKQQTFELDRRRSESRSTTQISELRQPDRNDHCQHCNDYNSFRQRHTFDSTCTFFNQSHGNPLEKTRPRRAASRPRCLSHQRPD
jgi:hypothetical protein